MFRLTRWFAQVRVLNSQYLTEKNNQRSLDKRWPQERIDREAANMYYKFLVNIHDKISSNFKGLAKHDPNKWRHFISVNEILDLLLSQILNRKANTQALQQTIIIHSKLFQVGTVRYQSFFEYKYFYSYLNFDYYRTKVQIALIT